MTAPSESTLCFLRYVERKQHMLIQMSYAEWREFWLNELLCDDDYMRKQATKGLAK